jgi:hypothetical protein
MPSLNKTITNHNDNHNEFPLDSLTIIIPIGLLLIAVCSINIVNCFDRCKYPSIYRHRNRDLTHSVSSMSSGLSYPTFVSEPKPKIFFIKEMKQYNVKNAIEMKDICPICIEEYAAGDKVVTMPCGHEFHKTCIHPWLRNKIDEDEKPICPMCKQELIVEYREEIHETDKGVIIEQV